jgi:hypothetical protein
VKPPTWNEIRARAAEFVAEWQDETDEDANAKSFWDDFFRIFNLNRHRLVTYEKRAKRLSTGGDGKIDVFWPGMLIAEHKSASKPLAVAEDQALDYLDSLNDREFPKVVISSNFRSFRITTLDDADSESVEFPITDLVKEIDRFAFIVGYSTRKYTAQQEEAANIKAAKLMAGLYEELSDVGYEGHAASVLLTRMLFLLFGDDTGLWERGLFEEFINVRTNDDGSDLGPQLSMLFQELNREDRPKNVDEIIARFPYVNGGLFEEVIPIPTFDTKMRNQLLECSNFDWGAISPAIFGSLFQAIKSKEARRELGEHYTTEKNILRLIHPLFLDDLNERFEKARSQNQLRDLHNHIGQLRFIDTACGCGNFLVIAYRELRELELKIMQRMRGELAEGQAYTPSWNVTLNMKVHPHHFYGIEIEEWPAHIARTAMFLTDHQANLRLAAVMGNAPNRLPITETATIVTGNALQIPWQEVLEPSDDVIVLSNPPFVGSRVQMEQQKEEQARIWSHEKRQGTLDYVTNWFKLAADYAAGNECRVGLVSTNSITQGEQPAVLWRYLSSQGMGIDFAHRTFAWTSEAPQAASVHCVITGFSARPKPKRLNLYDYPNPKEDGFVREVSSINPYLSDGPDIVVCSAQHPLVDVPPMFFGSMPRDNGHLSKIDSDEAQRIRDEDTIAAKYLRPTIGATEMLNGIKRWSLWLVDAAPSDLANSPELQKRIKAVREMREASKAASTRQWAQRASEFVQQAQPTTEYLAVPRVSSESRDYTPVAFYGPETIAMDSLLTVPGADLLLFGVMSSKVFTVWNRTVSGRLKSDPRISQELTYNNFPWLTPEDQGSDRITAAAEAVLAARMQFPGESLAVLYKPTSMPAPLVKAHQQLDAAALKAFGLKPDATEAQILSELLSRYQRILASGTLVES